LHHQSRYRAANSGGNAAMKAITNLLSDAKAKLSWPRFVMLLIALTIITALPFIRTLIVAACVAGLVILFFALAVAARYLWPDDGEINPPKVEESKRKQVGRTKRSR
jgi:hypothetical protein